jgi:hypothetical protein
VWVALADQVNTVRVVDDGITLNLEKFQFVEPKVAWVGYEIQHGGVTVNPSKLQAISRFPCPNNITELRSFMGPVE